MTDRNLSEKAMEEFIDALAEFIVSENLLTDTEDDENEGVESGEKRESKKTTREDSNERQDLPMEPDGTVHTLRLLDGFREYIHSGRCLLVNSYRSSSAYYWRWLIA